MPDKQNFGSTRGTAEPQLTVDLALFAHLTI